MRGVVRLVGCALTGRVGVATGHVRVVTRAVESDVRSRRAVAVIAGCALTSQSGAASWLVVVALTLAGVASAVVVVVHPAPSADGSLRVGHRRTASVVTSWGPTICTVLPAWTAQSMWS